MGKKYFKLLTALIMLLMLPHKTWAVEELKYIDIFSGQHLDVSEWRNTWDKVPTGATIIQEDSKAIVTGTSKNLSYGPVYMPIEIDLDKFPILEIEVASVTHHWYLILRSPAFKEGYLKLQPDTDSTGDKKYDLRLLTGLSGRQTFELQLGISTSEMKNGNLGEKLVFTKLRLSSNPEKNDGAIILSNSRHPALNEWESKWPDGRSSGAMIQSEGNLIVIEGALETQSYGCVYKTITLDLDKYPYLKINVASVSHHWYIIFISPKIEGGFVRVQPDTKATGEYIYDLRNIANLSGIQTFQLQVGVGTAEEKPSAKGEKMSFHYLAFLTQNEELDKLTLKKKDVVSIENIASVNEKEIVKLNPPEIISAGLDAAKPLRSFVREITDIPVESETAAQYDMFNTYIIPQKICSQPLVSKVNFLDENKEISLSNAYYKLGISKANGAILYIKDISTGHNISFGSSESSLWDLVLFKAGEYSNIKGNEFYSASTSMHFEYKWLENKKILEMTYNMVGDKSLDIIIKVIASDENFFDLQAEVSNKSEGIVISFILPWDLSFDYNNMTRFIFPHQMGIAFNKNFFLSKKRWQENYPPAFCDFVALESSIGNLAVYMVTTENMFQPTTIEVGNSKSEEGIGIYKHAFTTYIQNSKTWKSPLLRFCFFPSLDLAIHNYQSDNKLDKAPTLKNKLTPNLFERLSKSILIKIDLWGNDNFKYVHDFLSELPQPSLVHLTSFWPEGFDRHLPDYLPPNPKFGSSEDFKNLISAIHKKELLAMPYTNPTWWNKGPTLNALDENEIAARRLDGTLDYEEYNLNGGYIISPYHPKVIDKLAQTLQEFSIEYPMDLLFEDQLGARRWRYDLNTYSNPPIAYTQGLIDIAARDSKKIPIMTEGGFDKLIPYTTGFCGLTSLTMPTFEEFDTLWGKDCWEFYPLALYLAHPYVAFYQHNLANEVFTDSKAKLTWNLTYGHNLAQGRWISQWGRQKAWMHVAGAFQKAVASRCFGKKLTNFIKINKEVILSQFEDINILSNHSKTNTFNLDNYTIAKEGFLSIDKNKGLIAGILTAFNGSALWDELFLIIEENADNIIVTQPLSKTSLITVLRPKNWINEDWIHVYQQSKNDEKKVISAISPKDITFLYEAAQENSSYLISYKKPKVKGRVKLTVITSKSIISPGEKIKVSLIAQNRTKEYLENVLFALTGWVIKPYNSLPAFEAGYKDGDIKSTHISESFDPLAPGDEQVYEFEIETPKIVAPKGMLWLKGELIYSLKNQQFIERSHTKINISQP